MNNHLKTIESISLDFYNNNIRTINVKQYDSATRYLKISCTEHGKFVKLNPDTMAAFVRYKKPDGYYVLNNCEIASDGTLLLEFTQQMTIVSGRATADILILDNSNGNFTEELIADGDIEKIYQAALPVLSTITFYVNVLLTPIEHAELASSKEYDALVSAMSTMVALEASVRDEEAERIHAEEQRTQIFDSTITSCKAATDSASDAAQNANTQASAAQTAATNATNTVNDLVTTCNSVMQKAEVATAAATTATADANQATSRANDAAALCESVIDGSGVVLKENSVVKDSIRTENSVTTEGSVALGDNVQVISKNSAGFGSDNIAGCKGFYIKSIDLSNKKIYLCTEKVTPVISEDDNTDTSFETPAYESGDGFNIINDEHYNLLATISSVSNNVVTYEGDLGFTTIVEDTSSIGHSFVVPTKPTVGCTSTDVFCNAVATGSANIAFGKYSYAEGFGNVAGFCSHAEGVYTKSLGKYTHAEGISTVADQYGAHAEGQEAQALNNNSHAQNYKTQALARSSHAEGHGSKVLKTGEAGHAEGWNTTVEGLYGHSEGESTYAKGKDSHAEGNGSQAIGSVTHAEGQKTIAEGLYSHTEGGETKTTSDANYAHSEGYKTSAESVAAHSEGRQTVAKGAYAHAEGYGTVANIEAQHVEGKYNAYQDANGKAYNFAHVVGNGRNDTNRSNAHTLDWDGNAWFAGTSISFGGTPEAPKIVMKYDETKGRFVISVTSQ